MDGRVIKIVARVCGFVAGLTNYPTPQVFLTLTPSHRVCQPLNKQKMTTHRLYLQSILYLLLLSSVVTAQSVSKIDSGMVDKVEYRIFFPENWQHKLVMFAHGYEFMGTPAFIKQPYVAGMLKPYLDRGFAVAASSYQYQGFAMPQGVDDTEALRGYFVKQYGKPDSTLIVGVSMGGGVALATMENFDANYQGALALCPFSSRPYLQCRKEFDMYAVVNALLPGLVPKLSEVMDPAAPYKAASFPQIMEKSNTIRARLAQDSVIAAQIARRFDVKVSDLPMSLLFNENVLRDLAQKAGGNPFDNTNTIYSGFGDDFALNKRIERLPAKGDQGMVFDKYDRTGAIGKPVVLMHTVYDQLIPPPYGEVNFENMVHKQGNDQHLKVFYTNGQGHCQFKPEQIGEAFDALRGWVKSGQKPTGGAIE